MRNLHELDQYRTPHPFWPQTEAAGTFKVYVNGRSFYVAVSVDFDKGEIWEHISVTPKNQKRCPTWDEMAAIKDMFFLPEEECVQFHPKRSEYVNLSEFCLHIWRAVNGSVKRPCAAAGEVETLDSWDTRLEELWAQFSDVPMNPETECIEERFMGWEPGTGREEIWRWFDRRHSRGVAYLLYGGSEDYVSETKRLYALKQLCQECESLSCQFNHDGECRFALVHERKPEINDIDGCIDYDYAEVSD